MKKISFLLLTFIATSPLFAQLENTRWKATITIDGPVNVIFDFKKDSANIYTLADSSLIESMSYTHNDSSFTLMKNFGQSDCGETEPGKYSFKIVDNKMQVKLIADDCNDRSSVLDATEWLVWKEPAAIHVDEMELKQYTGVYQLDTAHPITITLEAGILYAEGPNNNLPKSPVTALGNGKFLLRIAGVAWDFLKDSNGNVTALISHEAKDYELKKAK